LVPVGDGNGTEDDIQPAFAYPTWRRSHPGGTTVSASVVASQSTEGSEPDVSRNSSLIPAARAAPALRAWMLITRAPPGPGHHGLSGRRTYPDFLAEVYIRTDRTPYRWPRRRAWCERQARYYRG
jgi:hypothetical protein